MVRNDIKLSFGLIGCGALGRSVHLPLLQRLPGLQLTAIADVDKESRERAASALAGKARTYESGAALLEREDLDGVVIASPPGTHAALATSALEKDLSVYLEKPLALEQEEGRQLVQVSKASQGRLMMGFNFRFNPIFEELREKVQRREAGNPRLVRTVFTIGADYAGAADWRSQPGGDVLMELGSHHFDLIGFLLGSRITAVTVAPSGETSVDSESLGETILTMQLENGVVAQSFLSYGAGLENRVEVFGSQGCLVADRFRGLRAQLLPPQRRVWDYLESIPAAAHTLIQLPRFMQRLASPWGEPSYRRSLQHLIDCMGSGQEPRPNAEDGYQCLRVVEAAREAIRRGETSYLR